VERCPDTRRHDVARHHIGGVFSKPPDVREWTPRPGGAHALRGRPRTAGQRAFRVLFETCGHGSSTGPSSSRGTTREIHNLLIPNQPLLLPWGRDQEAVDHRSCPPLDPAHHPDGHQPGDGWLSGVPRRGRPDARFGVRDLGCDGSDLRPRDNVRGHHGSRSIAGVHRRSPSRASTSLLLIGP
jgi:hypothetical protein